MKRVLFFAFVLALALTVCAQEEKSVPASQQDVKNLQIEIGRLRQEAKAVESDSMARSKEERLERKRMLDANTAAISALEKKLDDAQKANEEQARKASEEEALRQRRVWYIAGGGVGIVVILVLLSSYFRKKKKVIDSVVLSTSVVVEVENRQEVLTDPEIMDLKDFSVRNNGIQEIPFILTTHDGNKHNCLGVLRGSEIPLVYIGNNQTPVAWNKRRQWASKVGDSRPNAS